MTGDTPGRVTGITVVVDDPGAVAGLFAQGFDAPRDGSAIWLGGVRVAFEEPGPERRPRGVHALALACADSAAVRERLGDRPCGMRVDLVPSADVPVARGVIGLDHVGVASADNEAATALLCGRAGFPLESEQTDLEYRIPVETFVSNRYGVVQHAREPEPVGGLRVSFVTVGEFELELLQDMSFEAQPAVRGAVEDEPSPDSERARSAPSRADESEKTRSASAAHSDGAGNTRGDRTAIARYVASRGAGLHHLALRVYDIDRRLDRLAAAGLELIDRRGRPGSRRARIAFVHPRSLGGLLIHLVER